MKIIKFSASWCKPCESYAPVFNKVVKNLGITPIIINVEDKPEIAGKYKVMSIPCTIIIDDEDKEVFREVGVLVEKNLTDIIKKYF